MEKLTHTQENVLRQLVQYAEKGELTEEFRVSFPMGPLGTHTIISMNGNRITLEGVLVTPGVFEALAQAEMLYGSTDHRGKVKYVLRGKAFDAVRSNFNIAFLDETPLHQNIHITADNQSQVTVASPYSRQVLTNYHIHDQKTIEGILDEILSIAAYIQSPDKDEIEAEIATIRAQAKSPKPKESIISDSIVSLKGVTESLIASGIYGTVTNLDKLPILLEQLKMVLPI